MIWVCKKGVTMKNEIMKEIHNMLLESLDGPYDVKDDKNLPKFGQTRKKTITLRKLNELKKLRNAKIEELAQESIFIPYLYGPAEQSEGGDMMGGGMPM
jgi:hypothetical protein